MIQQNLDRYTELTNRIVELPQLVAMAERELTDLKQTQSAEKKMLEEIGEVVVDEAMLKLGKDWGSNDDIRKKNKRNALSASREYVKQERALLSIDAAVKRQEDHVSDLTRQYGAVCYQITHHAAMVQAIGALSLLVQMQATGQIEPLRWEMPTAAVGVASADTISEEEIAAIGL